MNVYLLEFLKIVVFPLILLLLQSLITIRPLKKANANLQKRLDSYSIDLINEYIGFLKDEQENYKRNAEYFSLELEEAEERGPNGSHEEAYWDYQSHINGIHANITRANSRVKEIPLEILDFIEKHRK